MLDVIEAQAGERIRKFKANHKLTAWLAMHIMNTQGTLKRPVTIEKLLGKNKKNDKRQIVEDRGKAFTKLLKKFEY